MKGLFRSKPLTPVELVHHVRELLEYTCPNPDIREAKRQDKVFIYYIVINETGQTGRTWPNVCSNAFDLLNCFI